MVLLALLPWASLAAAGHELPFYPGYYPQEIRIETVSPTVAGPRLAKSELHAYVGADPLSGRKDPADIRSVQSLGAYLVMSFNAAAPALASRESRCQSAVKIMKALTPLQGLYVPHPYPVTPFHPDYLEHFDLAESRRTEAQAAASPSSADRLKIRAKGPVAARLLGAAATGSDSQWDVTVEEVSLEDLVGVDRGAGSDRVGPPWVKQGWFHAYLLHAPAIGDRASRQAVDALYQRLVTGGYADSTEAINLQRALVSQLTRGCERVTAGYTLRRERFSAEFSQGIENVASDAQTGLNSPIFVRTVKLKDFPWNGWLRLGLAAKPAAAWNPIAGFSDSAGRLIWAALADPAMLPSPYGGGWVPNRVVPDSVTVEPAGVTIPEDALVPEPGTGALREVGKGKTARAKITYRVRASAFHDNTRMTAADAVYPYLFAARWGAKRPSGHEYDPAVDVSTALLRRSLAGFRLVKVDTEVKKYSDITFTYAMPIIDVFLDSAADPQQLVAMAPPWSAVPWHVMVLMEEAAKRGLGAFSPEEARRRGVRWLDLARDPKLRDALARLVDGFAKEAYVPDPLKRFVTADEAQSRWAALRQFAQRRGHFLVTSGPYRLDKWSESAVVLEVFRDFTNPMGVGSFDRFAIPRRAYVSRIVARGDRLEVQAEVERVEKFLRDYRIVREPLVAPVSEEERADVPRCRYVIVAADGVVVAAGASREIQGNRLGVNLKGKLRPGQYTAMIALTLGDNDVDPEVATLHYRVEASP
ncbi:MAG TPA: hypothetical protein VGT40_25245 [Methylomirabilota bacterium]|nr:hypothetical protein [Methylomirabilota bacterium]